MIREGSRVLASIGSPLGPIRGTVEEVWMSENVGQDAGIPAGEPAGVRVRLDGGWVMNLMISEVREEET